jgi:hypothetical protein
MVSDFPLCTAALNRYKISALDDVTTEHWWINNWQGENQTALEKTYTSVTLITIPYGQL